MGKHRADTPEPLPTLATSLATSTAPSHAAAAIATIVSDLPRPEAAPVTPLPSAAPVAPAAPIAPGALGIHGVLPPAMAPAPAPATAKPQGSSPIPAPILTTPRRSRVEVATPATVKIACWTAIVMSSLHAVGYGVVAAQIANLRGGDSEGQQVGGLLPGSTIAADAGGMLTLWALVAGLAAVACLAAAGVAYVALQRSQAGRIGTIAAAGGAAMLSLGPVFGDGSLWWLLTLFAGATTAGLLAWDGWWYDDSVKVRR